MFVVIAEASDRYAVYVFRIPETIYPFLSERIIEHCAPVSAWPCLDRFSPMDAVRRNHAESIIETFCGAGNRVGRTQEHFETLFGIFCKVIQPYSRRVSYNFRNDLVGSRYYIQIRTFPMYPVFACGVCHSVQPSGFIPHFEELVFRIPPYAAIFGTGSGDAVSPLFQFRLRFEYRVEAHFARYI